MNSQRNTVDIEQAQEELIRNLMGRVPHVVGVALRRRDPNRTKLDLCVYIDSQDAIVGVPRTFHGYKVQVQLVGTPRFA